MSAREGQIKFVVPGYEPKMIKIANFGINSLKKGATYEVKLDVDKSSLDKVPITLLFEPDDAVVSIDGKNMGGGKVFNVVPGSHTIRFEKDGYLPLSQTIEVGKTNQPFEGYRLAQVELEQVSFLSTPTDAELFVNGQTQGTTDMDMFLYPGSYQIRLNKSGYLNLEQKVVVKQGGGNSFSWRLIKNIALLDVSISPTDAKFTLNGVEFKGGKVEIIPGTYEVKIEKNGYLTKQETIELKLGKTTKRDYTLTKNTGTLKLNISPSSAEVLINKKSYGTKRSFGLAPGKYQLQVQKSPTYRSQTKTISIQRGKTTNLSVALSQITGKLLFTVKPRDAKVALMQDGNSVNSWQGAKQIKSLVVGNYTIEAVAEGYKKAKRSFEIAEGKTQRVDLVMEKVKSQKASVARKIKSNTRFIKIGKNGEFLEDDAKEWYAVYDTKTELMWEVKTDDGGLHDKDETYSWRESFDFAEAVNRKNYLGFSDWRVPTIEELRTIVDKSRSNPAIDTKYFSRTQPFHHWSSSAYAGYTSDAWLLGFSYGYDYYDYKSYGNYYVRLVR